MSKTKAARTWMQRHVADPYVRKARALGYRSRAAFKLAEIDRADRLFAPGQRVVDLGAAPGGWSQVAAEKVGPGGRVIAVDLLEMAPLPGVTVIRGDFTGETVLRAVERALGGERVDLVLSDMSPNLSGVAASDQARSIHLCELALEFALVHLQPEGTLLVKAFQGAGFPAFLQRLRASFERVASRKPGASRSRSSEMFLLARGPRAKP
ncbi:MAG: RlmE family RNA methyltransferase [Bacteroidota bacterium]